MRNFASFARPPGEIRREEGGGERGWWGWWRAPATRLRQGGFPQAARSWDKEGIPPPTEKKQRPCHPQGRRLPPHGGHNAHNMKGANHSCRPPGEKTAPFPRHRQNSERSPGIPEKGGRRKEEGGSVATLQWACAERAHIGAHGARGGESRRGVSAYASQGAFSQEDLQRTEGLPPPAPPAIYLVASRLVASG